MPNRRAPRTPGRLVLLGGLLSAFGRAAAAQQPAPDSEELLRLIEEQRGVIEAQGRRIEILDGEVADLRRRLDEKAGAPAAVTPSPEPPPAKAAANNDVSRIPEVVGKAVSVDDFPGSMPIPDTSARLKPGGWVRSTLVGRLDPMGSDDRFTPSSIPVGEPGAGQVTGSDLSARPTRLSLDLRTPTGVGAMRAFVEADFEGSGNTVRLRHAYGLWGHMLFGQTWSTFGDVKAEPDAINEGGFAAAVHLRQPVIRFMAPLGARTSLAVAVETPQQDVVGAQGQNTGVPDTFASFRFEQSSGRRDLHALFPGGGHVQAAFMVRRMGADGPDGTTVHAGGYGMNLTGRMAIPGLADHGWLLFGVVAGKGVGRYINDLAAAGGQDAVYNPVSGTLEPLSAWSSYLAFEHWWATTLRSTLAAGLVRVDNLEGQPDDALHGSDQASLNLACPPRLGWFRGRRPAHDRGDLCDRPTSGPSWASGSRLPRR